MQIQYGVTIAFSFTHFPSILKVFRAITLNESHFLWNSGIVVNTLQHTQTHTHTDDCIKIFQSHTRQLTQPIINSHRNSKHNVDENKYNLQTNIPYRRSSFTFTQIRLSGQICNMLFKRCMFAHANTQSSKNILPIECFYLLAFCTNPIDDDSWCKSLSTQHDQIMPPEHESIGLPPAKTHEMLRPHSNRRPLYLHVCGITAKKL